MFKHILVLYALYLEIILQCILFSVLHSVLVLQNMLNDKVDLKPQTFISLAALYISSQNISQTKLNYGIKIIY